MKSFKKDLNDVAKALKAVSGKVEKLRKQFAEMEKKHPVTRAKKAAAKRPVKKASVKGTPGVTAVDTVLGFVRRSRKGIDAAKLVEKTGYGKQKVYNIVARLKTQGKIKSAGRGTYVKA